MDITLRMEITMIDIHTNVSIEQVMKIVNKKSGEVNYLIMGENDSEWKQLTEEEYNKIRGL